MPFRWYSLYVDRFLADIFTFYLSDNLRIIVQIILAFLVFSL